MSPDNSSNCKFFDFVRLVTKLRMSMFDDFGDSQSALSLLLMISVIMSWGLSLFHMMM
jgi:hypothetical protein